MHVTVLGCTGGRPHVVVSEALIDCLTPGMRPAPAGENLLTLSIDKEYLCAKAMINHRTIVGRI